MCLILFSYRQHEKYRLILAANRDEFYERPTRPASRWEDVPGLVAGKDLRAGGTWLGVHENGRLAMLTNYRDPHDERPRDRSRGALVLDYLRGRQAPASYLEDVRQEAHTYNGFNALLGRGQDLWYYSNKQEPILAVQPGLHGISNHLLNTPWPKVERGKARFESIVADEDPDVDALFDMLRDACRAPDEQLPDTGIPLEWERTLSSIFIESEGYGTRSSSILKIRYSGEVEFYERTYPVDGRPPETVRFLL